MKEIKLTQGKVALVDDEDYEHLNQFKWCALKSRRTYYAKRRINAGKTKNMISMHNEIMGEMNIDHADHNGLNNQRYNLRECTKSENSCNTRPFRNKSSEYKGVYWDRKVNRFKVSISILGYKIHLGSYINEIDAAIAHDAGAIIYHGEFAYLNFPNINNND